MKTNIYLIGPMGAGKTSVGQLLSKKMHRPFYDSDQEIVKRTGVSISWIFQVEQEAGFRKREAQVIADLTKLHPIILATGGGAVTTPENCQALKTTGMIIYLKVSLAEQLVRTDRRKGERPLIASAKDRVQTLQQLNQQRETIYTNMADFIYDTDKLSAQEIAEQIFADLQTITVHYPNGKYPIYIGENLLHQANIIKRHIVGNQVMIVTNTTIAKLYLRQIENLLTDYQLNHIILPEGEQYKTLQSWSQILDELINQQHHRDTTLIALGGGVIGDLTGFAAACFHRGVNFIQIPTTLLAQIDASIGGKTAVDHPAGKNLIGAFHQPQAVIIDLLTLKTLSDREFHAGLAEVIKAAIIYNADFFTWLEQNIDALLTRNMTALLVMVKEACRIKGAIIAADEKEHNVRALCNLGHTFGHAIEQNLNYQSILHGEAVAIGIRLAADLSHRLCGLAQEDVQRIISLLIKAHLPITLPTGLDKKSLLTAMRSDKKILNQKMRFILIKTIGHCFVSNDVNEQVLLSFLADKTAHEQ